MTRWVFVPVAVAFTVVMALLLAAWIGWWGVPLALLAGFALGYIDERR